MVRGTLPEGAVLVGSPARCVKVYNRESGVWRDTMANVLITGGAGFIGSHLTSALIQEGHSVSVLDNLSPQIHGDDGFVVPDGVRFYRGCITDYDLVNEALENADVVFHLG